MQVEGRNPVIEALRSDKRVKKIYLQSHVNQDTKINELVKKAKRSKVRIFRKAKRELDKISKTDSHQGVIAFVEHIERKNLDDLIAEDTGKPKFFIFIREAFHEYNVGAITRSAECAGADAIILPPKLSVTPNIARASMGASEHIPILNSSLFPLIKRLTKENYKIVGIERSETSTKYYDTDLTGDKLLIIGGEDRSLSTEILDKCTDVVQIPMFGNVNSLNMSVASALVIFECVRQQEILTKSGG